MKSKKRHSCPLRIGSQVDLGDWLTLFSLLEAPWDWLTIRLSNAHWAIKEGEHVIIIASQMEKNNEECTACIGASNILMATSYL